MRNFRLLNPEEIEVRVQTVKESGVSALLYKTARTDYALLDETVGMYNWQNDYKVVDGKMYCGIGIRSAGGLKIDPNTIYNNPSEWVWKWNCGTESNQDAEKGQASDAMKRAGFAWGIGTELYSSPFIWIPAEKCNIKALQGKDGKTKYFCNDSFAVTSIKYDEKENISALVITNEKTRTTVFSFGISNYTAETVKRSTNENSTGFANHTEETKEDPYVKEQNGIAYAICSQCGEYIYDQKKRNGGVMTVKEYVGKCLQTYGKPLCKKCLPK